jgi:hypothetical protein
MDILSKKPFFLTGSARIYSISHSQLTLSASPCRIIYTICGSPSRHFDLEMELNTHRYQFLKVQRFIPCSANGFVFILGDTKKVQQNGLLC